MNDDWDWCVVDAAARAIKPGDHVRAKFSSPRDGVYFVEGKAVQDVGLLVAGAEVMTPRGTLARHLVEIVEHKPARVWPKRGDTFTPRTELVHGTVLKTGNSVGIVLKKLVGYHVSVSGLTATEGPVCWYHSRIVEAPNE